MIYEFKRDRSRGHRTRLNMNTMDATIHSFCTKFYQNVINKYYILIIFMTSHYYHYLLSLYIIKRKRYAVRKYNM